MHELRDHVLEVPGVTFARMEQAAKDVGVPAGAKADDRQVAAILAILYGWRIETPPADRLSSAAATDAGVSPPAPASGTIDEIAAKAAEITGGEVIPPKPGTPEYKALPDALTKAKARAYWDQHPEPEPETLAEQLRVGA